MGLLGGREITCRKAEFQLYGSAHVFRSGLTKQVSDDVDITLFFLVGAHVSKHRRGKMSESLPKPLAM